MAKSAFCRVNNSTSCTPESFELVAEQARCKPSICWDGGVLLKQEGAAAPGPTSLPGASPGAQQGFGSTRERLGMITQLLILRAAPPEPWWELQRKAGAESSAIALPIVPSMCRQCCCLTHTCCRISAKSCNENLGFHPQGGLLSSKECLFPCWNSEAWEF